MPSCGYRDSTKVCTLHAASDGIEVWFKSKIASTISTVGRVEGGHVAGCGTPVGPTLSKVLWFHGAAIVGFVSILDGAADCGNREDLVHAQLGCFHIVPVVSSAAEVDQAVVQDLHRFCVCVGAIRLSKSRFQLNSYGE